MSDLARAQVLTVKPYPAAQRFALYRIASVVNDMHNNEWWMTNQQLADEVGVTRQTVSGWMRQFVEDGWLAVVSDTKGGRSKSTRYRWVGAGATVGSDDSYDTETVGSADSNRRGKCRVEPQKVSGSRPESVGSPDTHRGEITPMSRSSSSIDSSEDPQGSPVEDEELIDRVITAAARKLTAEASGVNNPPAYAASIAAQLAAHRDQVARWATEWHDKTTGARLDEARLVTLVCARYRNEPAAGALLGFERVAS